MSDEQTLKVYNDLNFPSPEVLAGERAVMQMNFGYDEGKEAIERKRKEQEEDSILDDYVGDGKVNKGKKENIMDKLSKFRFDAQDQPEKKSTGEVTKNPEPPSNPQESDTSDNEKSSEDSEDSETEQPPRSPGASALDELEREIQDLKNNPAPVIEPEPLKSQQPPLKVAKHIKHSLNDDYKAITDFTKMVPNSMIAQYLLWDWDLTSPSIWYLCAQEVSKITENDNPIKVDKKWGNVLLGARLQRQSQVDRDHIDLFDKLTVLIASISKQSEVANAYFTSRISGATKFQVSAQKAIDKLEFNTQKIEERFEKFMNILEQEKEHQEEMEDEIRKKLTKYQDVQVEKPNPEEDMNWHVNLSISGYKFKMVPKADGFKFLAKSKADKRIQNVMPLLKEVLSSYSKNTLIHLQDKNLDDDDKVMEDLARAFAHQYPNSRLG